MNPIKDKEYNILELKSIFKERAFWTGNSTNHVKLKSFCTKKSTYLLSEQAASTMERIFTSYTSDQELVYKYTKN